MWTLEIYLQSVLLNCFIEILKYKTSASKSLPFSYTESVNLILKPAPEYKVGISPINLNAAPWITHPNVWETVHLRNKRGAALCS